MLVEGLGVPWDIYLNPPCSQDVRSSLVPWDWIDVSYPQYGVQEICLIQMSLADPDWPVQSMSYDIERGRVGEFVKGRGGGVG